MDIELIGEEGRDKFQSRSFRFREIKGKLRSAGFPVRGGRFPFAMHHNFYRTRIRIAGKKARHKDLCRLLDDWMRERLDDEDYFWQIVSGAVRDMISREPALVGRLPPEIREGMTSVDDGYAFLRYVKSLDFRLVENDVNLDGSQEKSERCVPGATLITSSS